MAKRKKPDPKVVARQKATIARLLQSATHYLGEINLPYVLIIQGVDRVITNTSQRHALSLIDEIADTNAKIRELRIERTAERIVDYGEDTGGGAPA